MRCDFGHNNKLISYRLSDSEINLFCFQTQNVNSLKTIVSLPGASKYHYGISTHLLELHQDYHHHCANAGFVIVRNFL